MEIQLINTELLSELRQKAVVNERRRMNYDLRTTAEDKSQRMLNSLEPGTVVPIHRHTETSETVVCLEGRLDQIFYEETGDGQYKEFFRTTLCPREGKYGIQIPMGVWHTIEVFEPSTIFEAKDGAWVPK